MEMSVVEVVQSSCSSAKYVSCDAKCPAVVVKVMEVLLFGFLCREVLLHAASIKAGSKDVCARG